jgi:hypothetical protein
LRPLAQNSIQQRKQFDVRGFLEKKHQKEHQQLVLPERFKGIESTGCPILNGFKTRFI